MYLKSTILSFLVLYSHTSLSNDLDNNIVSYYDDAYADFYHSKADLYSIPDYILTYENNKSIPEESDLNFIGDKYNIPYGLLYAMFWKESQLSCNKTSDKKAHGCFQFLYGTAKKMGLITKNKDYRTNPWISADAAARYLAWNFRFLGFEDHLNMENWKYVVAAYNAGPNKIKKGKELSIPMYTETQYYVDDIMGYVNGDKYIVKKGDLLQNIADENNIDLMTFKVINGNISNNNLQKGDFLYISIPKKIYRYIVQPGDNIVKIASITGVSPSIIGQTNNISSLRRIESGQTLYLPFY